MEHTVGVDYHIPNATETVTQSSISYATVSMG